MAWRKPKDKPKALEEFASSMAVPSGAKDFDPMTARWPDGSTTELAWLTVAQYRDETKGVEPQAKKAPKQQQAQTSQDTSDKGGVQSRGVQTPNRSDFEWFTGTDKDGNEVTVEPKKNNPKGKRTQLLVRILVAKTQLVQVGLTTEPNIFPEPNVSNCGGTQFQK